MRDFHPVTVQVGTGDLLNAGHGHFFDFTKLGEINFWPGQHGHAATGNGDTGGLRGNLLDDALDVVLHVFFQNTALGTAGGNLGQVDTELTGQTTHYRSSVYVSAVLDELGLGGRRCSRRGFGCFGLGSRSSRCGGGRGSCGSGTFHFKHHHQRAGRHLVTGGDLDFLDHTGERRRHFHRGLVAFHGQDGLVGCNLVANRYHHFGDFDFVTTDVGHVNVFGGGRSRCCSCCRSRRYRGSGGGCGLTGHFEYHDQRAGVDLVAHGNLDFYHFTAEGSRYFHGSLVAFYRDQGLLFGNGVADGNGDFGHFDFITADVRHLHFFQGRSCSGRRGCCRG